MKDLDFWRLCDELTIEQATYLILGLDQQKDHDKVNIIETYFVDTPIPEEVRVKTDNFLAVSSALTNAVNRGVLNACVIKVVSQQWDSTGECYFEREEEEIDICKTTVLVIDLKDWLASKNFKSDFFFMRTEDTPNYLDPNHSSYSPKLAAAICAWEALTTNPELIGATSVKQALIKWLRQNASRFRLTKDDGNPNEQGIEEVAKVANWDAKGGAPATPSKK